MFAGLFVLALACLIAALVGGGLKIANVEFPLLTSIRRQIALGLVAIGLGAYSLVNLSSHSGDGGGNTTPGGSTPDAAATPSGRCPTPRHEIPAVNQGTKTEEEARQDLTQSNFYDVRSQYVTGAQGPPDRVVEQSPGPGTLVCSGDPITLTVRK